MTMGNQIPLDLTQANLSGLMEAGQAIANIPGAPGGSAPLGGLGDSDVSAPPTVDTADMEIVSATGPASDYSEMYRATGNFTVDQDLRNRVKFYERGLGSTNYEQFIDSRTGLGKSGTIWEGMTLGQILGESQRFPRMSFLYEFEEQASPYIGYGGGASPSVG